MRLLVAIVLVIEAAIGMAWIAGNVSFIPHYGDTAEYFALSKTLQPDQYRRIFYPWFMNVSARAADAMGAKQQHIIYCFQALATFFAATILSFALLPDAAQKRTRLLVAAAAAAVVSLDPLATHFSLTVLTDSFATSFTLLYLAFLILALRERERERERERIKEASFVLHLPHAFSF